MVSLLFSLHVNYSTDLSSWCTTNFPANFLQGLDDEDGKQAAAAAGSKAGKGLTKAQAAEVAAAAALSKHVSM
jgi:hypothetical protein